MFDPTTPDNNLPLLPPKNLQLSDKTYHQLSKASRALATLNTYINTNTENVGLLVLGSFLIKEGVASSAIENINTTIESVFQADISSGKISKEDKEVLHYRQAILRGVEQIKTYGAIITNTLITIQSLIEQDKKGIRKIPGTVLINGSGDIVYTPPVGEENIRNLLGNLETYINLDDNVDPLIKLAVIHYQFESIHPFLDGNGRTGRILMIIYLVLTGLLKMPILYLSDYINTHKVEYYKVLRATRTNEDRDGLVYYILTALEEQSVKTTEKLEKITSLIKSTIKKIETYGLKIPYSFVMLLFDKPYNNIKSLERESSYSRNTIRNYLRQLEDHKIVVRFYEENGQPYSIPDYLTILYHTGVKKSL